MEEIEKLMKRPEFYDIFGVPIWVLLVVSTSWSLFSGYPLSKVLMSIFLAIGLAGLVVDGNMVFSKFIRKK